jgi:ATP-dependent RNA helicase DeaD
MSLKDFIRDTVDLGKDDVFKVDVKDSFSFFNTDAEVTEKILSTFTEFKVDGRFVNVEVSKSPGGGGGRGGRDKKRSGGRDRSRASSKGWDRNSSGKRRDKKSSGGSSSFSGKRRSKRKSDFF